MRRFEYVGGSSEKFWQIGIQGSHVTVTFGRIGIAGQTQVKDLGTEAAATSHLDKLVAEKVKKGYVEIGSPAPAATRASLAASSAQARGQAPAAAPGPPETPVTAAPDPRPSSRAAQGHEENALIIPAAWRRSIHPRRGGAQAQPIAIDRAAAAKTVEQLLGNSKRSFERTLKNPKTDAALAGAVRNTLGEGGLFRRKPAELDPLGAAGLAVLLTRQVDWNQTSVLTAVADLWLADQGLVFAALAAAQMGDVVPSSEGQATGASGAFFLARAAKNVEPEWWSTNDLVILERVRRHMVAAGDEDHAQAVSALRSLRSGPVRQRIVLSYLVPSEKAWVEEDTVAVGSAASDLAELLLAAVNTREQLERIAGAVPTYRIQADPGLIYSAAEGVGADAAATFARWFDTAIFDAEIQRCLLNVLAELPSDEAFGLLIDRADKKYVLPALIEATARFPSRAMRMLAESSTRSGAAGRIVGDLLRSHVSSNRDLADALLPAMSHAAQAAISEIVDRPPSAPEADRAQLHPVLVRPPWIGKKVGTKTVVVDGLVAPTDVLIDWSPGEKERWQSRRGAYGGTFRRKDWGWVLAQYHAGSLGIEEVAFFALAPPNVVKPYLKDFRPQHTWYFDGWLERIIGVYQLDALPLAMYAATSQPRTHSRLLLPFESTEIALLMADWYSRLKSVRSTALSWFGRHPGAAGRLIPSAAGKPGPGRRAAEAALQAMAQLGHRERVLSASAAFGLDAQLAVEAALATDPLSVVPPRVPGLPTWADPALLPQVLVRDRAAVLPPDAVRHLTTMLAMSRPGNVYAGVEVVKETCDPTSLAEFAWSLFRRWESAGLPSKEAWILDALGYIGDDETVRRLSPLIRAWPGEGGHARAVAGLDVLAAIGTDVALMHLHGISEKVPFKGLRARAKEKIGEVAADLGLTPEDLADRLVPDLGLDEDGSMTLDYGTRRFVVGFDEQLKPFVTDQEGARRKDLPKPATRDDATLAPDAYKRFAGLKKDVRTIANDQIRRLEKAMVWQRRWSAGQLRSLFIEHPLMRHIARRLVWATFDGDGRPLSSFRVAEDQTLADIDDVELQLASDVTVGIAHPLHLGQDVGRWSDLFADYEILQPFSQLGRDTHGLSEAERQGEVLTRFTGRKADTVKVLGLERFGWERGEALDAGIQGWVHRLVPGQRAVVIDLDPGIIAGAATEWKEQTLGEVWLNDQPTGDWSGAGTKLRLGELDDITVSEIIRELNTLVS